jgi:hypothetical protein
VEVQRELNEHGILINELNTGKLYRRFLVFLIAMTEQIEKRLEKAVADHDGLISTQNTPQEQPNYAA